MRKLDIRRLLSILLEIYKMLLSALLLYLASNVCAQGMLLREAFINAWRDYLQIV